MLGVIGGSGFEKFDAFETIELLDRQTPFGMAASGFKRVRVDGRECLFVSRHGEHHEHLPSEINYRANLFALKKQGASAIVSFSAVGSLHEDLAPGDMVVPYQYIDCTRSLRERSFLGDGLVGHVSLAQPICEVMAAKARVLLAGAPFRTHFGQTYVCIEGPHFSTKAESSHYRSMQAHVVGMSNFPEYALAREAGLPYLPCCFVTDYDCWKDDIPHVTIDEVIKVMKANNGKAFSVLQSILNEPDIAAGSAAPRSGLRAGLFMPLENIPADKRAWVDILMSTP